MLESDSDIEIVSPPRPAATAKSRPLFLPTSSAADPKHPRQPPVASSSSAAAQKSSTKAGYTAGAWASSPSQASSSSAAQATSASNSNERRVRDGSEGRDREAASSTLKTRQDAPETGFKSKGRAREMIVLSSGSDHHDDDDEPLVVLRRPPRASMPSLPSTSTSGPKSKLSKSLQRHSLTDPKVDRRVEGRSHLRDDSSDSSGPDPLMLRGPSTQSASSLPKGGNAPRSDSNSAPTSSSKPRKHASGVKSTGGRPTVVAKAKATADPVGAKTSAPSSNQRPPSTLQQAPSTSQPAATTASAQAPVNDVKDVDRPRSHSSLSSSSSAATRPLPKSATKPGSAASTSEPKAPPAQAPATSSSASARTKKRQNSAAARATVPTEPPPPASSSQARAGVAESPSSTDPSTGPLPQATQSAARLPQLPEPIEPETNSQTSRTPPSAGAGKPPSAPEQASQPHSPCESAKGGSAAQSGPGATSSSLPVKSTSAAGATSGSRLPATVRHRSPLRASSHDVSPTRPSASAKGPPPAPDTSAQPSPSEATKVPSAARAASSSSPVKPGSTAGTPSGSRLPVAVRNRSPLRASTKGVSPARSSGSGTGPRPAPVTMTQTSSPRKKVPVQPWMPEDSDSDIEILDSSHKSAPSSGRVGHAGPARSAIAQTTTGGDIVGGPSVENLTQAVTQARLNDEDDDHQACSSSDDVRPRATDDGADRGATADEERGRDVALRIDRDEGLAAEKGPPRSERDDEDDVVFVDAAPEALPAGDAAAQAPVRPPSPREVPDRASSPTTSPKAAAPPAAKDAEASPTSASPPILPQAGAPAAVPASGDAMPDGSTGVRESSHASEVIVESEDVPMGDVPTARRNLPHIATASVSSPSSTPGPPNPSGPGRIYGRGSKSTGRRPGKKRVHRIRAVESEDTASDVIGSDPLAVAEQMAQRQQISAHDFVAPLARTREDSEMAEAAEVESDGGSVDSSGSWLALQRALLADRAEGRVTNATGRPDQASRRRDGVLSKDDLPTTSQPASVCEQVTLEKTSHPGTRTGGAIARPFRPKAGRLSEHSSSSTEERLAFAHEHGGVARKSSGQRSRRTSQQNSRASSFSPTASAEDSDAQYPATLRLDRDGTGEEVLKDHAADRTGHLLKRDRVMVTGIPQLDSRWAAMVQMMQNIKLPLLLVPADIEPDDPDVLEAQRGLLRKFKRQQKLEHPWERLIAGPSYDFLDEFSTDIQDTVNRREAKWAKLHPDTLPIRTSYRVMFEQMILEALSDEYGPANSDWRPQIRVCPPRDLPPEAMPCPPFDFIYTNRVVYDDDIVPVQAPGCGCEGDCDSPANRKTCSCLARQIKVCETKTTDRSNHQDFAYDRTGKVQPGVFDAADQIIECNSQCGCGPQCINRVVGNRKSISVDIFWTGIAGWGARLPPSYASTSSRNGHAQRTIQKGEPLAVYAGELMRSKDAYERDDNVYTHTGRNYIFDLDAWTVLEDIASLLPSDQTKKLANQIPSIHAQTVNSHRTTGSKQRAKGRRTTEDLPHVRSGEVAPVETEASKALYSVDAFHVGNWTRFCNHVCTDFNVLIRPVYIDEADVSRPLFVYFARRDIHPGEEITITYFGGEEEVSPSAIGYTDAKWKRAADEARDKAPKPHRCYCGKKYCRGRMFGIPDQKMFWDGPDGE
ncbi:hypothetical protein JCM3774_003489 [Rhodotorula dairenensis]